MREILIMSRFLSEKTIRIIIISIFIVSANVAPLFSGFAEDSVGFLASQSTATWEILDHEYIQDDTIFYDMCFINATHGWVVGQNETGLGGGIILLTNDGGTSWNLQLYNESQKFGNIEIIDAQTIWVSGRKWLFFSKDGGQSWNTVNIVETNTGLAGLEFSNYTHGWVSTVRNVFRTIDQGKTWKNDTSWSFNDTLRMIEFISPTKAWAIGFRGIYYSDNGGDSWVQQYDKGGWALSIVSNTEGWAISDHMLAHMVDGENWVEQTPPRPTIGGFAYGAYFSDIQFLNSTHGWIIGLETTVAHTTNGGLDWYAQSVPSLGDQRMFTICFINATHGWVAGSSGYILRTSTGNSLGTRLWNGFTDYVLLTTIGVSVVAVLVASWFLIIRPRKYRNIRK
jgi:photosystem II stability/assembly factor-like uncharacterized protein